MLRFLLFSISVEEAVDSSYEQGVNIIMVYMCDIQSVINTYVVDMSR